MVEPDRLFKLGLGTAQFGLDYPHTDSRGRPPEAEVGDILQMAARARVPLLDATVAFGAAERALGAALPRPNPFRVVVKTARSDRGPDFVETEARASLARLGVDKAYAVVVQSAADLLGPYGQLLWDRLKQLRDEGLFDRIGVSLYASDDPTGVVRRFKPDIVQAPASLLDQRLLVSGELARLAEMGVEIHLRSIFLQGLLFLPPDRVPAELRGASGRISRVRRMIAEGRSDPLQAALGFALSRPEASSVIVGVSTAAELAAVMAAAQTPPPELDWDDMAMDDPAALDSHRWAAA